MSDAPTIGHNSAGAGEILDENPGAIFDDPSMLEMLADEIKAEIKDFDYDLSSDKSRKRIATFAARIARQKTALDRKGKDLNEDRLAANKAVNKVRNAITDTMDELRDKAREPLNAWEAEQETRQAAIKNFFDALRDMKSLPASMTAASIEHRINDVVALEVTEEIFGESQEEAITEKGAVLEFLRTAHEKAAQDEKDRAELKQLRKDDAEREAAEEQRRVEEQKKADADEAKAAEEKRIADAEERAREATRAEEKRKADDRVAKAEAERDAAEKARKAAAQRAEADKAVRDAEEAERKAEDERRKADADHRQSILDNVSSALQAAAAIDEEASELIVSAIVRGDIPHTEIKF